MDGTRYWRYRDGASVALKKPHTGIRVRFLLFDHVAVFVGRSAEIHAVAEIPFGVSESVVYVVSDVVCASSDIVGKAVNIVLNTVMILTLVALCIAWRGRRFVPIMIAEIAVVASVDVAAARTGRHTEHS